MSYHMNPDIDSSDAIMKLATRQPSFKRAQETVLTIFQSGHGFVKQSASGSQSDDTVHFIKGTQSLKLTTDGDGVFVNSKKTGVNFDLTGKYIKMWIMVDDPTNVQDIRVQFSDDNFATKFFSFIYQSDFSNLEAGVWEPITISWGNVQTTGAPARNALTSMIVRCTDKNTGKPLVVNFGAVHAVAEPSAGVCVITFDDGLDSLYTKAKAKMDQYGYQGVAYIIPSSLDQSGRVTTAQVQQMYKEGWDISGHDHPKMTTVSLKDCDRLLKQVKYELLNIGCSKSCEDFAWPNGGKDQNTIAILSKYYRTGRSITEGLSETLPPANDKKIRIMNINNSDSFASVQTRITQTINNKELLVLCFHGIVDTVTDGSTQTSTTVFNQIIDELNTQGLAVKTLSQLIKDF